MKIVVAIAFILIIGSLTRALYFLMRDRSKSDRAARALAWRVGFSVALFALILLSHQFGWIAPSGMPHSQ